MIRRGMGLGAACGIGSRDLDDLGLTLYKKIILSVCYLTSAEINFILIVHNVFIWLMFFFEMPLIQGYLICSYLIIQVMFFAI